jgi:hypothetical protein
MASVDDWLVEKDVFTELSLPKDLTDPQLTPEQADVSFLAVKLRWAVSLVVSCCIKEECMYVNLNISLQPAGVAPVEPADAEQQGNRRTGKRETGGEWQG